MSNKPGGNPQLSESSSETNPVFDASVNSDDSSCLLVYVTSFCIPQPTSSKLGEKNYIPDDLHGLLLVTLEQRSEGRVANYCSGTVVSDVQLIPYLYFIGSFALYS